MQSRSRACAVTLVVAAGLTACNGSSSKPGSAGPLTTNTSVAATATASPSSPAAAITSSAQSDAASPSESSDQSTQSPQSAGPHVLDRNASGKPLHRSDVFSTVGTWSEQRYDVADQSKVFAMGATVTCGTTSSASLELRLANRFSQLSFQVGQATDSASSDETLVVDVIANSSEKKDNRSIPFNKIQDFAVDVKSVGALKINFTLQCKDFTSSSVIAVVQGMTVTA